MRNILFLFLSMSLVCYAQKSKQKTISLNSAANDIYHKILFIEKEFYKMKKGKPADFNYIQEIVELSKIEPKESSNGWSGTIFIPEENDIKLWKEWLNQNKSLFSYDEDIEFNKYYFNNKNKLIKFEFEKGKFRRNVSEYEIDRIKKNIELIKVNKNTDR